MAINLTKTDYILYRECKKNVWHKIHKPEIYLAQELSEFEKQIIETGNEVELTARKLFPSGILIQDRGKLAQEETQKYIVKKKQILFQPIFMRDNFLAAADILELNDEGTYNIYEVKSTADIDKKTHYHDLAFQVNLLSESGLKIKKAHVIHLNSEYVREGELNINRLFKIQNVTLEVEKIKEAVMEEMKVALQYIRTDDEPLGYCDCVYKGRSNHCSTFKYSNPKVPVYGVHDISRIGASKAKLQELIDSGIFDLKDVPDHMEFSLPQKNQITVHVLDKKIIEIHRIKQELDSLVFPLYFLDYETFPCAIPRFNGFSPYQQMPFQYSLYVLDLATSKPKHFEFLFSDITDPTLAFIESLQNHVGSKGSIIVWNKGFECKINSEIAKRNTNFKLFVDSINARVYDLMDIFLKQYYVDKNFKGKVSIKNVLPVLIPELSYKELEIQEGGTASQKWNEINVGNLEEAAKQKIIRDLKEYCKLDTYAMYAIWKYLYKIVL